MRRSVVPLLRREKKSALHRRSACGRSLRAGINKRYEDKEQDRIRAHSGKVSR